MRLSWGEPRFTSAEVQAMLDPWKAIVAEQNTMLQNYHTLYGDLLSKYHALKVSGTSVPDSPPTFQRSEFDPVQAAITAKAGPDKKLRAMMSREAMQARAAGIDDMEIIQQIEQGVSIDDEGVL